jgi:hypothetical protein
VLISATCWTAVTMTMLVATGCANTGTGTDTARAGTSPSATPSPTVILPAESPTPTTATGPTPGPDGYGDVHLLMSTDDAIATGLVGADGTEQSNTCMRHDLTDASGQRIGNVFITARGVEAITVPARTPEGIGPGSSFAEAEAAYPDFVFEEHLGRSHVPVPGRDDAVYRISYYDHDGITDTITDVTLQLDDQTCYE